MRKSLCASWILILIFFVFLFAGCGEDSSESGLYDQIVEGTTNEINQSGDGLSLDIEYMSEEEIEDAIWGVRPSVETTDIQLLLDSKESYEEAQDKYVGKVIQVTGTVKTIIFFEYDQSPQPDWLYLLGDYEDEYPYADFTCIFADRHNYDDEFNVLDGLDDGDKVTVKGYCAGASGGGELGGSITMRGCTIVDD